MELNFSNKGLFSFDGSVLSEEQTLLADKLHPNTHHGSRSPISLHSNHDKSKKKKSDANHGLLPKIIKIDLSYNNLHLFTGGGGLRSLAHLNLSHNQLSSLYTSTLPPTLIQLNLSHNRLQEVTQLASAVPQLEQLDLSHNVLTAEGVHTLPCRQLTKLNVSYNAIECMDPFSGLTRLTDLNLSHNAVGEEAVLEWMERVEEGEGEEAYTDDDFSFRRDYESDEARRERKGQHHRTAAVEGVLRPLTALPNLKRLDLRGNPLFPSADATHTIRPDMMEALVKDANWYILTHCKKLTLLNKIPLSQSNQNQMFKARQEKEVEGSSGGGGGGGGRCSRSGSQTRGRALLPPSQRRPSTLRESSPHISNHHTQHNNMDVITSVNNYNNSQIANSKVFSFARSTSAPPVSLLEANPNDGSKFRRVHSTVTRDGGGDSQCNTSKRSGSVGTRRKPPTAAKDEQRLSLPLQLLHTRVQELRRLEEEDKKKLAVQKQRQQLLIDQVQQLASLSAGQADELVKLAYELESLQAEDEELDRVLVTVNKEYEQMHAAVMARKIAVQTELSAIENASRSASRKRTAAQAKWAVHPAKKR